MKLVKDVCLEATQVIIFNKQDMNGKRLVRVNPYKHL